MTTSTQSAQSLLASREINHVVVLGANGTMGFGSGVLFTQAVPRVTFLARTKEKAEQGLAAAKAMVRSNTVGQRVDTGSYDDLEKYCGEADLIFEAVTEQLPLKQQFFARVDAEMSRLLSQPEVRERVIAIPFVPDDVLVALYRHAHMLLFASLYEGFGLPALEAMALGTPVLASTAPAVLEVTGPGALHAVPTSHRDLVARMQQLARDEPLRARLTHEGKAWVRGFQWDKAARLTLQVYREALAGGLTAEQ